MSFLRRTLLPALAALGLASAAAAAGWESIESLPGRSPETVTVRKKPRVYFRVTPQTPLTVSVTGPARLRVISRAVLAGRPDEVAAYQLVALEGGRALLATSQEAGAARGVRAAGVAALGKGRRMMIQVPDGTHAIQLMLTGTPAALVRLQRAEPEGAPQAWVSLTPIKAPRSVSVIEGEKSIAYYSLMPGQPVVLRVVGPSTLDCLTRLDYDATMTGTQAYRLRIVERGRTLRTVDFRTTKSGGATYAELKDRVPSRYDRFSLPVGNGLHEIEVHLVKPANGSAEIHARIPEPSVGNTE
jgi:hypothetical protein